MAIIDIAKVARQNSLIVDCIESIEQEVANMDTDFKSISHDIMILADIESIEQWENWFELPPAPDYTEYDRKVRLIYTFNSRGFFSKKFLHDIASTFTNSEITINEDYENYHFEVQFESFIGTPENLDSFAYMVEINKPAHLTWRYIVRFRTHKECANYRHSSLAGYTHKEIRGLVDIGEPSFNDHEYLNRFSHEYLLPFDNMNVRRGNLEFVPEVAQEGGIE